LDRDSQALSYPLHAARHDIANAQFLTNLAGCFFWLR
jgi:hypothetical protein